jgi:ubiquinone/menaquinone biosynthesis C-methylase UbiE
MIRMRRQPARFLLALVLAASGCAQLKQCAYEGVNRDAWQQPERVIAALQLRPGAVIADLGSGGGYFTFRLAEALGPTGKVYAIDTDPDMIGLIAETAQARGARNIEPVLAKSDDPMLPQDSIDLVFTSNTYHHIESRVAYFANLRRALRPGGRLAVIEFDRRGWLEGLLRHYTPRDVIRRELEQAGYTLQQEFDFLDRQSFLIFAPRG